MTNEEKIIKQFCWEHIEYASQMPSLRVNLWGDIMAYDFKTDKYRIIAESDLHGIHIDKLGYLMPKTWKVVSHE